MRITFIQGLDKDYQRHYMLKKADTLQEFLEKAREYEKNANIGNFSGQNVAMAAEEIHKSDQDKKLDSLCEMIANLQIKGSDDQKSSQTGEDNRKNTQNDSCNSKQYDNGNGNDSQMIKTEIRGTTQTDLSIIGIIKTIDTITTIEGEMTIIVTVVANRPIQGINVQPETLFAISAVP